jgi:hypothetical protein
MPPPPSNNVRVAKPPIQQQVQPQSNSLPFSKLSISDAIGLVTLRLGRIEQFVIDYENGEASTNRAVGGGIPENSKVIDNSVLTSMINRLDSLEKREPLTNGSSSVNNEQVSKIEKDLKETKDLLAHMLFKFELFSKETNDKFSDFENAFAEIEKSMVSPPLDEINDTISASIIDENISNSENVEQETPTV